MPVPRTSEHHRNIPEGPRGSAAATIGSPSRKFTEHYHQRPAGGSLSSGTDSPSHLAQAISNERWVLKTLGNHFLCGTTQHTVTQVEKPSLRKKMCDTAQNLLFVTRSESPGQNPRGHLQPSGNGSLKRGRKPLELEPGC